MKPAARKFRKAAGNTVANITRLVTRTLSVLQPWIKRRPAALLPVPATLNRPYPWERSYPRDVKWDMPIRTGTLVEMFDEAVRRFSDRPCLDFLGKRYTYAQVDQLVRRAAKGLVEQGLKKGDRVGLFLPNSPYFVICYYAILRAGCTVVNFNPMYVDRGLIRQITDSGIRFMVTMNLRALYPKIARRLDDTCLEKVIVCSMSAALPFPENALFSLFKRGEMSSTPSDDRHVKFETLTGNDGKLDIAPPAPRDVALLQYTGGTTGFPKGAILTHETLYANTIQTRSWAPGIGEGSERMLAVLPLFHVFGMTGVMNVGLYSGSELLMIPRFKIEDLIKIIEKERPTVFLGVPTMFSAINGFKDISERDLSSLNICISGGAPLPLQIKTRFEELTGCVLVEGYGLTESAPVCTINPLGGLNKPGSAGLPVPGTVIEIVSLDNPDLLLPLGETGEICIAGPQIMTGFWGQAEETATALRGGRLHTGDVGYMDEDGYLFIIDRIKDLIITGGFNVYPRMVEDAIRLHPAVEDVAVCGIESIHHGELVKAYVVLHDGAALTSKALREFLADKLAPYEMPRRVEFTKEIPKTMLGKPLRRELIAKEAARSEREREAAEAKEEEPA